MGRNFAPSIAQSNRPSSISQCVLVSLTSVLAREMLVKIHVLEQKKPVLEVASLLSVTGRQYSGEHT